jgi:hypothetical protein
VGAYRTIRLKQDAPACDGRLISGQPSYKHRSHPRLPVPEAAKFRVSRVSGMFC